MQEPKVFEFAKEIGMETLTLMNKIREWGLPVKSHMVALPPEMLDEIKKRLDEEVEAASSKKQTKKKAAKKKAAAKKTAAKKATTKKVAAKKTATKKAVTKKAATKKTKAKTVIRRKKVDVEAAQAAAEEEAKKIAQSAVEETTPVVTEPVAETSQETPAAAAQEAKTETPVAEKVTEQTPEAESKAPPVARKVAVNVADGEVSGVMSAKPKNIVGRMDLSRVSPPPSSKGNANKDDSNLRTPRSGGGRNLRAGFVAAPEMVPREEPVAVDRRREKKEAPAKKPGAGKEQQQPTHFSSTEFRKREMVFQPKKKKGLLNRESKATEITTPKASKRVVKVDQQISVLDLANAMGLKTGALMTVLVKNGVLVKIHDKLDFDTVSLIVPEFGWEAQNVHVTVDEMLEASAFGDLEADQVLRAPVVTIMGHVDHGKTTLLDSIRKANVVSGEAGGITQHIAAYSVHLDDKNKDKVVTFIDTPGHEAFTAMRARGANVTDIVVIVVAADDGVMPQTIEAINHAKAAGVSIIVAVNKVDKPDANVEKIKQQLTEFELIPEEWGGSTIFVEVSALNGTGITDLLEQIWLLAEVSEYKANPKRSATGIVIEGRMEKGRGNVATVLVKNGTLKVGQYIVAGQVSGKVRSLINDMGKNVKEAGPSMPVEILGLSGAPSAGDRFDVCKDEAAALKVAAERAQQEEAERSGANSQMSLDALFAKMKAGGVKELPVVLKTDVVGSAEAIRGMFEKVNTDEVKVKVIHSAIGAVNESDVLLASTSGGIVVGFNVRPDSGATQASKDKGVEIKTYRIVYELIDDIKKAMSGLLDPDIVEKVQGHAEVRETFSVPRVGTIAGCSVVDGKIARSHLLRLTRDGVVVYEGKLSSLKRFKDDAKEVAQGYECGIGIENFNDLKTGDIIEAYIQESVEREL